MTIDVTFATSDEEAAAATLSAQYASAELRPTGGAFEYRQSARGEDWMSVARLYCTAPMVYEVDLGPMSVFGHMTHGTYAAVSNQHPVDTSVPYVLPYGAASASTRALDVTVLNVDRQRLAGSAVEAENSARIRFHGFAPIDSARAQYWTSTLAYAARTFADDELFANELIRQATLETLRAATLLAFPIEVDSAEAAGVASATLRRARTFIEEHAQEPITVVDVANAARVSIRGLQGIFHRELGVAPVGYLRRVRLEQVRRELAAADSSETLVRDVARKWGFVHLGRFAAAYREAFGRTPNQDLRQ